MANQACSATFLGRSGKVYTLVNTAVAEGSTGEELLSGPSPYALTSQSLGDYAQGDVLIAGLFTAQTDAAFCYVSYGGDIVSTVSICTAQVVGQMVPLARPLKVKPGMVLQGGVKALADKTYYMSVETASQSHVFTATSTTAATYDLVSITTGQQVGRVLNQPVVCAFLVGVTDTQAAPQGAIFVNGQGTLSGFIPLGAAHDQQPMYSKFVIPMDLNTRAQIVATA
jgi:hypothetical protein